MKTLIIIGMVLSAAGFAINLVNCIKNGTANAVNPLYPILQYSLLFFATVALFSILVSVLVCSRYSVDDKYFKTQFGFIVSKYKLTTIETITLDRKTDKLTVTIDDGNFIVIVVRQDWYTDFIDALLKANPKIEYSIVSSDNKPDGEKK